MRIIAILTLISLVSISAFWYTEVATPYQQEFTADKVKEVGHQALGAGQELYDNREQVVDEVKGFGRQTLHAGSQLLEKGQQLMKENKPFFDKVRTSTGNLLQKAKEQL